MMRHTKNSMENCCGLFAWRTESIYLTPKMLFLYLAHDNGYLKILQVIQPFNVPLF